MRRELTRERLRDLMREIARTAPRGRSYHVFFVGGGTAILADWRDSTIDADLHSDQDEVFRDIQGIKDRLQLNVEFARPEQFVPALAESVRGIPATEYSKYPALSRPAVLEAMEDFLARAAR